MTRKDLEALVADCGLTLERVNFTTRHPKLYVRATDGRRACFVIPRTSSDHRSALNKRAQLRAFAQGRHAGAQRGGRHAAGLGLGDLSPDDSLGDMTPVEYRQAAGSSTF